MWNLDRMQRWIAIPDEERPWWRVIAWWERRRLPYNLIVGVGGTLGLLIFFGFSKLPPRLVPQPHVDPLGVLIFAAGANFFYTSGWVAELAVRALWPQKPLRLGPPLLFVGSLLSVMLALFPGLAGFVGWAWRACTT